MQALLEWVSYNADYAIFAVFVVSLLESLALVGIMVPGMLFMLGVGTLVGIGTLPLWPMLISATAGAVAGDGLSFWLGRHFNDNLRHLWPLYRYPGLLHKGEQFFHRHGAMSVFFGRFIGPLRAIIPAVAGMLQMPAGRFYLFNLISAIGWAPVVIMPGALLGASLTQVSGIAMRLGVLFLVVGLALWGLGWIINHAYRRLIWNKYQFELGAFSRYLRWSVHAAVYWAVVFAAMVYDREPIQAPSQRTMLKLAQSSTPNWERVLDQGFVCVWQGKPAQLSAWLQQQSWVKAESWRLSTAMGWLSSNMPAIELPYQDPRASRTIKGYRIEAWIKPLANIPVVAGKEPLANKEPSAGKEPSASKEQKSIKKLFADNKPLADEAHMPEPELLLLELWIPQSRSDSTVILGKLKHIKLASTILGYRYFYRYKAVSPAEVFKPAGQLDNETQTYPQFKLVPIGKRHTGLLFHQAP